MSYTQVTLSTQFSVTCSSLNSLPVALKEASIDRGHEEVEIREKLFKIWAKLRASYWDGFQEGAGGARVEDVGLGLVNLDLRHSFHRPCLLISVASPEEGFLWSVPPSREESW